MTAMTRSALLLLLAVSLCPLTASGQEAIPTVGDFDKALKAARERVSQHPALPDTNGNMATAFFDDSSRVLYDAYVRQCIRYNSNALVHNQEAFAWHHRSSVIIFFTVLILVLSGVLFAAIQFWDSMRTPRGSTPPPEQGGVHQFEASLQGIKVASPVLGVVILGLSFAFFYLYLVYVYPLHQV